MDIKNIMIYALVGAFLGCILFVPTFFLADVFVGALIVAGLGGGLGWFIEHQKEQQKAKQPMRFF